MKHIIVMAALLAAPLAAHADSQPSDPCATTPKGTLCMIAKETPTTVTWMACTLEPKIVCRNWTTPRGVTVLRGMPQ